MNQVQTFLKNSNLSQDSISLISNSWNKRSVIKKNDYLLETNKTEKHLYFIVSGCIASIVETENKDSVLGFGYTNSIITSFTSFTTETPSELALLAIYDTELLKIEKKELNQLVGAHPEIAKWYYSIIEKTLIGHMKRQIELTTLTPSESYKVFMKRSGHLVNSIPLKYISSYLNMTPETLSRVRKLIS
ncbi:MAG: CRP-like cAMP-binding protein [Crocinitomix sp.]|jgi:CRP-like cAMP-binding protein